MSAGVLRCGACGARMEATFSTTRSGGRNHYYRCSRRRNHGKEACANGRGIRVREVEPLVWEFVCSLLKDPDRLRRGVELLVEREERLLGTDVSEREVKRWATRARELERKRSTLQDMAAEGLITFSELATKLDAVEEAQREARRHLEELGRHQQVLENLRQGTENLLDSYSEMIPEGLEALPSEARHRVYQMLELTVTAHPDGNLLANMILGGPPESCPPEYASSYPRTPSLL